MSANDPAVRRLSLSYGGGSEGAVWTILFCFASACSSGGNLGIQSETLVFFKFCTEEELWGLNG